MDATAPHVIETNHPVEAHSTSAVTEIDVHTAFEWVKTGIADMLDVREAHEYAVEKIENADFYPLSQFDADKIPETDGKKLILFCAVGKRSIDAGERLLKSGHTQAYSMQGGLIAWDDAGYPIIED